MVTGWVLCDFPTTAKQAALLEKKLSGFEVHNGSENRESKCDWDANENYACVAQMPSLREDGVPQVDADPTKRGESKLAVPPTPRQLPSLPYSSGS